MVPRQKAGKSLWGERRVFGDYRDFAADDDTNGSLFFLRALEDDTYTSERSAIATAKDLS